MVGESLPSTQRIILKSSGSAVELRQHIPEDAPRVVGLIDYDRDHLRQFGEDIGDKYHTPEEFVESVRYPVEPDKLHFGIWHYEDGSAEASMVGSINLMPVASNSAMGLRIAAIGWWVGREHIGHGYAAEACKPLLEYAFNVLGFSLVFVEIAAKNVASRRTAEKRGFHLESIRPPGIMTYVLGRSAIIR